MPLGVAAPAHGDRFKHSGFASPVLTDHKRDGEVKDNGVVNAALAQDSADG